ASKVFGQYLVLDRDERAFTGWLQGNAGVLAYHANAAYHCLNTWAGQNL
ncbi:barrier to autointegration factor, partial [Oesophagostomum dentatum]